jgi:cytosine/adenosine deaminase-related metal-dependent hydrolase
MPGTWTIQARWLFPVDGPPLEGGTLTAAAGRIVALEPFGQRRPDVDLGDVAVLPGLVNAHTHLDLSGLPQIVPPPADFTQWLRQVVAYRRTSVPAEWDAAIRAGVDECLRSGTTLVGDIAVGGRSAAILAASPLRAVVFHELIGLSKARARQAWKETRTWLQAQQATPQYRPGLSPHAPYSVRRSLFRLAARQGVPVAIHLAETPLEEELLTTQSGPLRGFLQDLGAWDASGLVESLAWIVQVQQLAQPVLYVHGNYLRTLLRSVANRHGANRSVVYCPRTHAYFGHPPHPFVELLRMGVNVALGTDSRASNPDLSILDEMRFIRHQYPSVPGADLLRMGTLAGAQALGWEQETGSLTVGKAADWVTVPLEMTRGADPYQLLFASRHPVREVWIQGKCVASEQDASAKRR